MRHLCARIVLALLGALAVMASPHVGAQGASSLLIAARYAEPVPLDALGDPKNEELFVYADVRYSGADVLHLSPWDFRIIDDSGVEHRPRGYEGANPLDSGDLVGKAHVAGWLLFTMPKGARNLSLGYQLTEQLQPGATPVTKVVQTARFTPRPNPKRLYAVNAQQALDAYLLDEALAAGYIRMEVDPLYADGGNGRLPGDVRARLQRQRALLRQDHRAFDLIAVPNAEARRLKLQADTAFTAIEADLATASALRRYSDWLTWHTVFTQDDRALADLYQIWPGLQ